MPEKRKISVNRMLGKVPMVASLSPVQMASGLIAFLAGYLVYSFGGSPVAGVASFLWVFFTSVLVLGKHHWQFLNKFRERPNWSHGRRTYRNLINSKKSLLEIGLTTLWCAAELVKEVS